jgi:hypothetical protein
MDYLINFVNNTRSHFPTIISLFTNYNPITFPHSFFTPCSKIDYSQEKFVLKQLAVAVSWLNYSDVFFGLQLIVVVFEQ